MRLIDWILPVLLVAVWASSWRLGTRRFRLWFAVLAPWVCVAGVILALAGSNAQADGSCPGGAYSCDGGAVQRWAASFDSPPASVVWFETSSLLALGVAVALLFLTLIVEYILLVLRQRAE